MVAKTYPSNYSNEIKIPSEVVYEGVSCEVVGVGQGAFANCKVTSITLPETIRNLDTQCFYGCKNLKSLQLPNGLKYIGDCAFSDSGLESITIPESVIAVDMMEPFPPQLKSLTIDSSKSSLLTGDSSVMYH